ncbi:MAG TPA: AzlD domain-containing protein [bacterium]|jgi:branched-subunit amino acid transport protein
MNPSEASGSWVWLTILAMGAVTYALRASMILLMGRIELPALLRRALRLVPPAVLSAIILPELVRPSGQLDLSLGNEHLFAGAFAAIVAWRTRNTFLTVGGGLAALWILRALLR